MLYGLCALAALLATVTLVAIAYQLVKNADPAISKFGLGFLVHNTWLGGATHTLFGAAALIYGTLVSSAIGLLLAAPLGIAIGIYLAMIAPPAVRAVVGPLVEMLAAIPSIIIGFWGFLLMEPFLAHHVEPTLHSALGFLPIFGSPQTTGGSLFAAGLVLTLMMLPIIASLCRDLFLTVPQELKDGATALGATQWEVIRGVVLSNTTSGVIAATVLGLGRALGEAIAVSYVIGDLIQIHGNLFLPGSTAASLIADQFIGVENNTQLAALFYLAVILLAIGLITSLLARVIASRFNVTSAVTR